MPVRYAQRPSDAGSIFCGRIPVNAALDAETGDGIARLSSTHLCRPGPTTQKFVITKKIVKGSKKNGISNKDGAERQIRQKWRQICRRRKNVYCTGWVYGLITEHMEVADDPAQTEPSSPSVKTKWGSVVTGGRNGYQILPDALVRNQGALGLTCTDMVVLVNILMHWWEREPQKMPHPRPEQIAKRMGATVRTVQRSISRLCRAELLEWMPAEKSVAGPAVRSFNVKGLKAKLKHFAQQVEVLDENAV